MAKQNLAAPSAFAPIRARSVLIVGEARRARPVLVPAQTLLTISPGSSYAVGLLDPR